MFDWMLDSVGCSPPPPPVELPPPDLYARGLHLAIVRTRRNHPRALDPKAKTGNYLNSVLALDEARKAGRIKEGDLTRLVAFGAGLTYGSALIRW